MISASVPSAWQIVAAGDLDGDRKADLVWHQNQTGDMAVWVMNGASVVTGPIVNSGVPLSWRIVKLADVNGDGKMDLVWRHDQPQTSAEIVNGEVAVWQMDGTTDTRTANALYFTEQIYQTTAKWQIQ